MKLYRIFTACILSVALLSCDGGSGNPGAAYNRAAMLQNEAESVILPGYEDAVAWSTHLQNCAAHFTADVNSATLHNLQDTFSLTFLSWKKAEFFYVGPAETTMLARQVDSWPTNTSVIESEIGGANTIDDAYILATGTTRKGFPAIEYLVWPYGSNDETAILNSFTVDANAARRKIYLTSLCNVIRQQTGDCYGQWQSAGNYLAEFIAADGTDVAGSATQLMNALIQNLEVVINYKIAVPLGLMSGGSILPEKAESFRAGLSSEAIVLNLEVLKDIYTGGEGEGFDDYLDFVEAEYEPGLPLSQKIAQQFDLCKDKASQLSGPVHELVTTDPASLNDLYLSLKQLLVLIKSDMSSRLGLLITFSDNDGD